jgi:hypothetical protein
MTVEKAVKILNLTTSIAETRGKMKFCLEQLSAPVLPDEKRMYFVERMEQLSDEIGKANRAISLLA